MRCFVAGIVMSKAKLELLRYGSVPVYARKKRSREAKLKTCSKRNESQPGPRFMLPAHTNFFHNQVAGHNYQHNKDIGK